MFEIFCVIGDVVSAMEVLVCEDTFQPKSAFSPLGSLASAAAVSAASATATAAYVTRGAYCGPSPPTRHRFLAAPYTGTGYLPTVIRPPNQTHSNGTSDTYRETSPDDASDKTSYSEWSIQDNNFNGLFHWDELMGTVFFVTIKHFLVWTLGLEKK